MKQKIGDLLNLGAVHSVDLVMTFCSSQNPDEVIQHTPMVRVIFSSQ